MSIFEKDIYLNKSISFISGVKIYEYDIKEAGWTVLNSNDLISKYDMDYLNSLNKQERNIAIGKMNYKYNNLSNDIISKIREVRLKFIEANNIQPADVLAIRKDAIIVINNEYYNLIFDKYVFRKKETYTSYIRVRNIELYYNSMTSKLDIKGISDDKTIMHETGFMNVIKLIMKNMEYNNQDQLYTTFKIINDKYLNYKYPISYYREFSITSLFRTKYGLNKKPIYMDNADESIIDMLDISYNYLFIVDLFKLLI